MAAQTPNAISGLPYSLVEVDEPKRGIRARLREADALEWKLWLTKYAWLLSLLTMAPGVALLASIITGSLAYGLAVAAALCLIPAWVFWRRTKGLP